MNATYLAIENDISIHERESQFWKSCGVTSIRVTSMSEGITLAAKEQFLYIGINADNIHYKSSLRLLREVTNAPIFMATSNYTQQEHTAVTRLGADLYGLLSESPEDNYDAVMAHIEHLNYRAKIQKPNIKLTAYRNILLSEAHRLVLVNDKKIGLTKIDFAILHLLMENRGRVLSPVQIYRNVWINKSESSAEDAVKSAIKRIRKKLSVYDVDKSIIKNVRGLGYGFVV